MVKSAPNAGAERLDGREVALEELEEEQAGVVPEEEVCDILRGEYGGLSVEGFHKNKLLSRSNKRSHGLQESLIT